MISSAIKVFGYLFCSQSRHAVEQIVKRTVIWDAMALMWIHCNYNVAKRDFGITNDFVSKLGIWKIPLLSLMACCWVKYESIVVSEQIVERTMIWDVVALMWSHCNDNAAKCDFGITNDYVFNERVLMFPLLLASICRWTNNRMAGDLTLRDAHVGSL